MVDFNVALIKKIVRMLESEHDGERAAAAGKLAGTAKGKGKNIDEMLAAVYGGGARQSEPRNDARPKRGQSSWGNEWGGTNFKDPPGANSFAEAVRRAEEALKKQQAARAARERAARGGQGSLLGKLQAQVNAWGTRMLTVGEHDFITGIFNWHGNLTGPQEAMIERILEKYAAYAARNGEAESFWKA